MCHRGCHNKCRTTLRVTETSKCRCCQGVQPSIKGSMTSGHWRWIVGQSSGFRDESDFYDDECTSRTLTHSTIVFVLCEWHQVSRLANSSVSQRLRNETNAVLLIVWHHLVSVWPHTRKPCCRKETARCWELLFSLKVASFARCTQLQPSRRAIFLAGQILRYFNAHFPLPT